MRSSPTLGYGLTYTSMRPVSFDVYASQRPSGDSAALDSVDGPLTTGAIAPDDSDRRSTSRRPPSCSFRKRSPAALQCVAIRRTPSFMSASRSGAPVPEAAIRKTPGAGPLGPVGASVTARYLLSGLHVMKELALTSGGVRRAIDSRSRSTT